MNTWREVLGFTRKVAEKLVARHRTRLTLSMSKQARQGKILIDVLRNAEGATAVGTWSTRARPGAPIAVPVRWDEVVALGGGDRFHIRNVMGRVATLDRPAWEGFEAAAAPIPADWLEHSLDS